MRNTWAKSCAIFLALFAAFAGCDLGSIAEAARKKSPVKTIASQSAPAGTFSKPVLVQRDVLALYDGSREDAPAKSRIHRQLEMPLNHLGYRVAYHDIRSGYPDHDKLKDYAAVVTWFSEQLADYRRYLDWAAEASRRGTKFVIIDVIGSPLSPDDIPQVNRLLSGIGLVARSIWIPEQPEAQIVIRDDKLSSQERPIGPRLPGFMVFEADQRIATSHLAVSGFDLNGSKKRVRSDVVVTGPGGGFIQYGFGQLYDSSIERLQWITDPIAFLEKALGKDKQLWPAPDTTTLAGRRIFFSHIDGDGWNNISEFRNERGVPYTVAEIVRDRLIRQYVDLPVSVGLIACDISAQLGGNPKASLLARDLFEMKNVEVASHTHSHPYNWSFFKSYSRNSEIALHNTRTKASPAAFVQSDESQPSLRSGYSQSGPDMPRANFVEPFDLRREIMGALETSSALAPANKKARLYLWSGDTSPFEDAIAATRAAGVRNMNGGDSRFDAEFPSMSYVPPIGKPVGRERQIYAVNSNENTYTNGWTRDFGGQARVTETWENTNRPRRLKGMNVYYHMYAGQKPESLAAVNSLLKIGRESPVIPIPASQYAAIADSFYGVEITRDGPAAWTIYERGDMDTVRFDARATDTIDLQRSTGVLGYRSHNDDLYVALDPAVPKPTVTLTIPSPSKPPPIPTPNLVESRWQLSRLERRSCGFKVRASGFGRGEMIWSGMYPGVYSVTAFASDGNSEKMFDAEVTTDGVMRLNLDIEAIRGVELDVACQFAPPPPPAAAAPVTQRKKSVATKKQTRPAATPRASAKTASSAAPQ